MASNFMVVGGSNNLPENLRGAVVAIGNFDGIHIGHQYLLSEALDLAKELNYPALVLTFEPHPITVHTADKMLYRISTNSQKYKIIEIMGFSGVVEQPFDEWLMNLSSDEFIDKILIQNLGVKAVVVGGNFCFGKNRAGNYNLLASCDKFITKAVNVQKLNHTTISSSYIRELLSKGQVKEAADVLGYHFIIEKEVIHGAKLGRKLGFPTVNMEITEDIPLKHGIYAVKFIRSNGKVLNGVASVGKRPTVVEDGKPLLETYLFDFNEEIYGEHAKVVFFEYIREEKRFANIDQLVIQMKLDAAQAAEIVFNASPISEIDQKLCF